MDWQKRWREGDTPWDLGNPHEETIAILRWWQSMIKGDESYQVLIPLCGTCHDAVPFLESGHSVEGWDVSPTAIDLARRNLASWPHFSGRVIDIFDNSLPTKKFDLIFDRAAFCALKPSLRTPYLDILASLLHDGGFLGCILFNELAPGAGNPPFPVDPPTFTELIAGRFQLVKAVNGKVPEKTPAIISETVYLWRKS